MKQSQFGPLAPISQPKLREESSRQNSGRGDHKECQSTQHNHLDIEVMLDATYNRLQELMQLLYLLSRDASVPSDARYHVTIAQSEIALLTRLMQNSVSSQAAGAQHAP